MSSNTNFRYALKKLNVLVGHPSIGFPDDPPQNPRNITKRIIHEKYNSKSYDNDIAIAYMEPKLILDDYTQPICIPKEGKSLE